MTWVFVLAARRYSRRFGRIRYHKVDARYCGDRATVYTVVTGSRNLCAVPAGMISGRYGPRRCSCRVRSAEKNASPSFVVLEECDRRGYPRRCWILYPAPPGSLFWSDQNPRRRDKRVSVSGWVCSASSQSILSAVQRANRRSGVPGPRGLFLISLSLPVVRRSYEHETRRSSVPGPRWLFPAVL